MQGKSKQSQETCPVCSNHQQLQRSSMSRKIGASTHHGMTVPVPLKPSFFAVNGVTRQLRNLGSNPVLQPVSLPCKLSALNERRVFCLTSSKGYLVKSQRNLTVGPVLNKGGGRVWYKRNMASRSGSTQDLSNTRWTYTVTKMVSTNGLCHQTGRVNCKLESEPRTSTGTGRLVDKCAKRQSPSKEKMSQVKGATREGLAKRLGMDGTILSCSKLSFCTHQGLPQASGYTYKLEEQIELNSSFASILKLRKQWP